MKEKKDFSQMKKEVEEMYLRIGNQIAKKQAELNSLITERTRMEGKLILLEELEKNV